MTSAERRHRTQVKLAKRKRMAKAHGLRGGTMYEKHIAKLDTSLGYMRDGHVTHFVQVGFGQKTNNRGNYGKRYNPSIRDMRSNNKMYNQLDDMW